MDTKPLRLIAEHDPAPWAWGRGMVEWLLEHRMGGSMVLSLNPDNWGAVEEDWAKEKLTKSLVEGVVDEMAKRYPNMKRLEGVDLVRREDFKTSFTIEEYTDVVLGQAPASDIRAKSRVMRMHAVWRPVAEALMVSADGDRYWVLDRMISFDDRHADINSYTTSGPMSGMKVSRYTMFGWLPEWHRWLYREVETYSDSEDELEQPQEQEQQQPEPESEDES